MIRADLHIHSCFSDGTKTPEMIAKDANEKGIGLLSVCDHDIIGAYPAIYRECEKYGIKVINGVEITTDYHGISTHILAYGFDFSDDFRIFLAENRANMEIISDRLIIKMEKDYPEISYAEYLDFKRDPLRGGWKGVDYIIQKGVSSGYPDCMRFYKDYYCDYINFPPSGEVIERIHAANGVAILAHAGVTFGDGAMARLEEFKTLGIDGAECYYPRHKTELVPKMLDWCEKNGMYITAGSDDHGAFNKKTPREGECGITEVEISKIKLRGVESE